MPANPSPFEAAKPTREAPPPRRERHTAASRPKPQTVAAPVNQPVAAVAPAAAPPAPGPTEPPPQPVPPARIEPENVTPPPPPPAPPEPHRVTLNAGTMIPVRLVDGLTSERNLPGDSFTATLDKELVADGFVIAERGARVEGRVVASDKGGRVKGVSSLSVELVRLNTSDGQKVVDPDRRVRTASRRNASPGRGKDRRRRGPGRDHRRPRGRRQGRGDRRGRRRRRRRGRRDGNPRQAGDATLGDARDVPPEGSGDDHRKAARLAEPRP